MHGRQAVALAAIGPGARASLPHAPPLPGTPCCEFPICRNIVPLPRGTPHHAAGQDDRRRRVRGGGRNRCGASTQFQPIQFEDVHRRVGHLFPPAPCPVLDIGAGTGRDAAGFVAAAGRIVAVEPSAASCVTALELHSLPLIEWVDDGSPELAQIARRRKAFDLVLLRPFGCISMQARRVMPVASAPVAPGETMVPTQRRGPLPAQRADIRRDAPKKRSASPTPRGCSRSSG